MRDKEHKELKRRVLMQLLQRGRGQNRGGYRGSGGRGNSVRLDPIKVRVHVTIVGIHIIGTENVPHKTE